MFLGGLLTVDEQGESRYWLVILVDQYCMSEIFRIL